MATHEGMTNAELLAELQALGDEIADRLDVYLEAAEDERLEDQARQEAADAGLLFTAKANSLTSDMGLFMLRYQFEKAATRAVAS